MNGSREQSPESTQSTQSTRSTRLTQSAPAAQTAGPGLGRALAARRPWTVLCAVAAVVLGPAAATASALEQANKAPLHHAVRIDQPQAYIPADSVRRKHAA
ncbi:hypothetical protein ABT330_08730 [Streptomyces sp. NPDC000658]|uniref:hypothetical protein n=1 Tax=Streptomyces sp. NPDC000658 TaxID=3154266 RepID=UPI0033268E31